MKNETRTIKLADCTMLGTNLTSINIGDFSVFIVDRKFEGAQTENSKGLDKKNNPKQPKEMVASTGSHSAIPGTDCRVMLHLTRPMSLKAVKQAKALVEMDSEDTEMAARVASVDPEMLKNILAKLGV